MTVPDPEEMSASHDLSRFVDDPFITSVMGGLADICLVISPDGQVMAASGKTGSALAPVVADWSGANIWTLLDKISTEKLRRRVEQLQQESQTGAAVAPRWAELGHVRPTGDVLPVRYALYLLPDRRNVLMLGNDQRPTIEMQQMLLNAQVALERDHETQREIDTRYRLLMDFTSDAIVLVSATSGRVIDLNHDAAAILGRVRADLVGKPLADYLTGQTRESLVSQLEPAGGAGSAALLDVEVKASQRKLMMAGKLFRASGEQLAILRLTDPEGGSVGDQRLA